MMVLTESVSERGDNARRQTRTEHTRETMAKQGRHTCKEEIISEGYREGEDDLDLQLRLCTLQIHLHCRSIARAVHGGWDQVAWHGFIGPSKQPRLSFPAIHAFPKQQCSILHPNGKVGTPNVKEDGLGDKRTDTYVLCLSCFSDMIGN